MRALPDSIPGGIDVWFSCVVRICSLSVVLISIIDNGTPIILHSTDQNSNFLLKSIFYLFYFFAVVDMTFQMWPISDTGLNRQQCDQHA